MNWWKKSWFYHTAALEPGAWDMHETTHRLTRDQPNVTMPWGGGFKIKQTVRPQGELEQDYYGVHVSQDLSLAAVYANNISSRENMPIVFEISTFQSWDTDIDANVEGYNPLDELEEHLGYDVAEKLREEGESAVSEIMSDIQNIEIYDDGDGDPYANLSDHISEQAKNRHPSVIVNYFESTYPDDSEVAFLEKFLKPVFLGEGELDNKFQAFVINQMRFMEPVYKQGIAGIYTFEPFYLGEAEFDGPEYTEEGKRQYLYDDVSYGSVPDVKQIWQNPQLELFKIFKTYYHGTNISRARQSMPEFESSYQKVEQWAKQTSPPTQVQESEA